MLIHPRRGLPHSAGPAAAIRRVVRAARPVGNGAVADLATRDWKAGNGHRKAAGI